MERLGAIRNQTRESVLEAGIQETAAGDFNNALASFRQALELGSDSIAFQTRVYIELARMHYEEDHYAQALGALDEAKSRVSFLDEADYKEFYAALIDWYYQRYEDLLFGRRQKYQVDIEYAPDVSYRLLP